MQRCLQLAVRGRGKVAPNPMVGCVIVHNNEIIGEGWHMAYGGPHAEVNAIAAVQNKELLPESTVYVSLEPCSHHGKTPPCADLLIQHKVKTVVVGCTDPHAKVAGRGIQLLREAGIEVIENVLKDESRKVNERFFTFHEKHRPFVILKWAETRDGYMAGVQKQISGTGAQTLLHQWRSEEAALMVGTNTLLQDNPMLNVRYWQGHDPVRIAVDFNLRSLEQGPLHFFDDSQKSILLNGLREEQGKLVDFVKIADRSPAAILEALYKCQLLSVLTEGGSAFLQSFIDAGSWDEIRVFRSKELMFGEGLKAPVFEAQLKEELDLGTDILSIYRKP